MLVAEEGPISPGMAIWLRERNRGSVMWGLECLKCGKRAEGTDDWYALGHSVCSADDPGGVEWRQHTHDLAPVAEGFQCVRCHLPVPAARWARAGEARCPAWSLEGPDGVVEGSVQWSAQLAHMGPTWKRMHGGIGRLAPVVGLPLRQVPRRGDVVAAGGPVVLRPYREHVLV